MATEEEIAQALALLEATFSDSEQPPAVIVLPPDDHAFMIGNRGGFVRLAMASLKAALGKEQSFKNEPWIVNQDIDWGIKGLKPDENAHISLAELSRPRRFGNLIGCSILIVAILLILIGLVTTVRWITHSI